MATPEQNIVFLGQGDFFSLIWALPRRLAGWRLVINKVGREEQPRLTARFARLLGADQISSSDIGDEFDYLGHYELMVRWSEKILDHPSAKAAVQATQPMVGSIEEGETKLRACLFSNLCPGLTNVAQMYFMALHFVGAGKVRILPQPREALWFAIAADVFDADRVAIDRAFSMTRCVGALMRGMVTTAVQLIGSKWRRYSFSIKIPSDLSRQATPQTRSGPSPSDIADKKVIVLPHQGVSWGNAFTKDYLFRTNPNHPMHRNHVVMIEYDAPHVADSDSLFLVGGYAILPAASQILKRLRAAKYQFFGAFPTLFLIRLARTLITINRWQRFLANFPSARTMIVGYDVHCPKELILGAQANGIRCVALQERNIMAFAPIYTLILDDYLISGPAAALALRANKNVIVKNLVQIGPVRSSWLHYRPVDQESLVPKGTTICILDASSYSEHERPDVPSMISWENNRLFLTDIINLAKRFQDYHFVLRGRDANWTTIPYFQDMVREIDKITNLEINNTYDRFRVSYEIVDKSSLIICRHTSLGDEALAAGIPTIFYERSVNGTIWMRSICDYDGAPIFALGFDDLALVFERALQGQPAIKPAAFEMLRNKYFSMSPNETPLMRYHRYMDGLLDIPSEISDVHG